jgi:hypothetical protein
VVDEPYFVELLDPGRTEILLTASYGPNGVWPIVDTLYGSDRSLQADGKTRVLGYTRHVGDGAVTYFALGHCHNRGSRPGREGDAVPPVFRGAWESDSFISLLRNSIALGVGD